MTTQPTSSARTGIGVVLADDQALVRGGFRMILDNKADLEVLGEAADGRGGTPPSTDGGGRGIAGMRERATMLGGTLDAGPLPEGGFRVHARLPLETS